MPKSLNHILIKFMQSLIELVFFLPLILIIIIGAFPKNRLIIMFALPPVFYLAGVILCSAFKSRAKAYYFFSGFIITGTSSLLIFGFKVSFPVILFWAITSFSVYRGIKITQSSWMKQSQLTLFGFQIAMYFVSYFIFLQAKEFKPYLNILTIGGVVSIFLFLLLSNFDQLKLAIFSNGNKNYIPASLLKSNLSFLLVTFIFILVISQIKQFWTFVWFILKSVLSIIYSTIAFIESLFNTGGSFNSTPGNKNFFNKGSDGSDLLLAKIIFNLLITIVLLGSAILAIYIIIKFTVKLIKWLSGILDINEGGDKNHGYTDEKENLMKYSRNYISRFKKALFVRSDKEPGWKDLKSNRDKVRYIYKQAVLKSIKMGYSFKSYLTPSETGRDLDEIYTKKGYDTGDLISLYNKARYGTDDIYDIDVEKLHRNIN